LAGVYFCFGIRNYLAVSLVQSIVSLFTVAAGQVLGTKLLGPRVGWMVAVTIAFYPSLLVFNCLTLSETLFTLWFTLAVLFSVQFQKSPSWQNAAGLGIAIGLGALTRSVLWVCGPPIFLCLMITSQGQWHQRIGKLSLAGFLLVAILAPWAWRNTSLQRTFTLIDVMGGRNVMMGNYEYTPLERSWATITDVTGERSWNRVLASHTPEYATLTQGQIDKLAMRYGMEYFFDHPAQSLLRCSVRFFNFWQLEREIVAGMHAGLWGPFSRASVIALALVIVGGYACVILSACGGLFCSSLLWRQQGLLLLWIAVPCAVHTIAFAHSRYHLPLMPVVAIFAAAFWGVVAERNKLMFRKALWFGLPIAGILVAGWLREIIAVDLAVFFK